MISLLEYMDDECPTPEGESLLARATLNNDGWMQANEAQRALQALDAQRMWCIQRSNPLAAMCNHKDTHSSKRLPVKHVPSVFETVAPLSHKFGGWGA